MRRGLLTSVALLLCACECTWAQEVEFPYPAVPDSLTQPDRRMAFLLDHYWENYSFADSTQFNRKVGEQGFVDFLELLQYADSASADAAVEEFVKLSVTDSGQGVYIEGLIDHYLGLRESPLRDDRMYAVFLNHMAKAFTESNPAYSNRLWFLRNNVMKNQVGSVVSDFNYCDEAGKGHRLYETKAELIIIDFHDPDCKECRMVEERMKDEPLLHNPAIVLLKIHPEEATPQFYIPTTPTFYILDSNYRVIKKDITYEQMRASLTH